MTFSALFRSRRQDGPHYTALPQFAATHVDAIEMNYFDRTAQHETPSSAPSLYTRHPLVHGGATIRLLELQAAPRKYRFSSKTDYDAPLRGTLKVVALADAQYSALSYVWGPHGGEEDVMLIGDTSIRITPSCRQALQSIRHQFGAVSIWIDAICIDQQNKAEKLDQIPLMGAIYSQANFVYIWLGTGDEEIEAIFEQLDENSEQCVRIDPLAHIPKTKFEAVSRRWLFALQLYLHMRHGLEWLFFWMASFCLYPLVLPWFCIRGDFKGLYQHVRCTWDDPKFNPMSYVDETWFAKLLKIEWQERVWTYQELLLANQPVLLYGKRRLHWSYFMTALWYADRYSYSAANLDYWRLLSRLWITLPRRIASRSLQTSVTGDSAISREGLRLCIPRRSRYMNAILVIVFYLVVVSVLPMALSIWIVWTLWNIDIGYGAAVVLFLGVPIAFSLLAAVYLMCRFDRTTSWQNDQFVRDSVWLQQWFESTTAAKLLAWWTIAVYYAEISSIITALVLSRITDWVAWFTFLAVVFLICPIAWLIFEIGPDQADVELDPRMLDIQTGEAYVDRCSRSILHQPDENDLTPTLRVMRENKCSEAVDRYFGVEGILREMGIPTALSKIGPEPSLSQVYQQLFIDLATWQKSVNQLLDAGLPAISPGAPTWIPQLQRARASLCLRHKSRVYKPTKFPLYGSDARFHVAPGGTVLNLQAELHSSVIIVCGPFRDLDSPSDSSSDLRALYMSVWLFKFRAQFKAKTSLVQHAFKTFDISGKNGFEAAFERWFQALFCMLTAECADETTNQLEDSAYERIASHIASDSSLEGVQSTMCRRLALEERVMFLTNDGRMGTMKGQVIPDDIVALIPTVSLPMVLRSDPRGKQRLGDKRQYQVVGPAYIPTLNDTGRVSLALKEVSLI